MGEVFYVCQVEKCHEGDQKKILYCQSCNDAGKHQHFPVIRITKVLQAMNVSVKEALQKIETLQKEAGPKLERLSPLIRYLELNSLQVPSH